MFRVTSLRHSLCRSNRNILFSHSTLHQSTDSNLVPYPADSANVGNKLFGATASPDSLDTAVSEQMLTRTDFGFYQKILPIDTVQEMISGINFLFDTPFWMITLALPFVTKALITIPIHVRQQRKYESRLPTLPVAVYEINKCVQIERVEHVQDVKRARGSSNYDDHIYSRKAIHKKYGYNVSKTQLLSYTAAAVQLPIHLTMFVSLRTMAEKYPLWTQGGPEVMDLANLALTDSSMVLPASIGCTMGILQYLIHRRNEERDARISKGPLIAGSALVTVLISYYSLNWSIGFNLYILSNLSSYVVQTKLMDNNTFRRLVGLKRFSELKPHIRKLQIGYAVMKLTAVNQVQMKKESLLEDGDNAQSIDVIALFSRTWVELLRDKSNFERIGASQQELDAYLADIQSVDGTNYVHRNEDGDDEDEHGEGDIFNTSFEEDDVDEMIEKDKVYGAHDVQQKYSFEFLDREDVAKRREQIRKSMGSMSTREYLMAQKMQKSTDGEITTQNSSSNADEGEYQVKIHDVDGGQKRKKKKRRTQ